MLIPDRSFRSVAMPTLPAAKAGRQTKSGASLAEATVALLAYYESGCSEQGDVFASFAQPHLSQYAAKLVRDYGCADFLPPEDLVQETFLRVVHQPVTNRGRFVPRNNASLVAWLRRIMRNELINAWRVKVGRSKKTQVLRRTPLFLDDLDTLPLEGLVDALTRCHQQELLDRVTELMRDRPPLEQQFLQLLFAEGCRQKEVASLLQMTDVQVSRLRKFIFRYLRHRLPAPQLN